MSEVEELISWRPNGGSTIEPSVRPAPAEVDQVDELEGQAVSAAEVDEWFDATAEEVDDVFDVLEVVPPPPPVDPTIEAAARRLGVPAHEVQSVRRSARGLEVRQSSGPVLVIVDPASPDALGQHGLLVGEPWKGLEGMRRYTSPEDLTRRERRKADRAQAKAAAAAADPVSLPRWQWAHAEIIRSGRMSDATRALLEDHDRLEDRISVLRDEDESAKNGLMVEVEALRVVLKRRLAQEQADYLTLNPPPPQDWLIDANTQYYRWASALIEAPAWQRPERHLELSTRFPLCASLKIFFVEQTLDGARAFFAEHGMPLPDLEDDAPDGMPS